MADAAVAALVKDVVERLTSVAAGEFRLLWGFKKDVLALKNDFEEVQAVLQDAEEKRVKKKAVELWLKRLKFASLEVENVLDDISTEGMLQSLYKKIGKKYTVRRKLMFRFTTAHKVKALQRKLEEIKSETLVLKLSGSGGILSYVDDVGIENEMPDRETSSLIRASLIFGRKEETEMVADKICNKDIGRDENDDAIRVFSIWGMGGLGKTTLAQLVYDHERVNRYFELKCWVHVSEKFQPKEIIKRIIESIDKCECTITQLERLQESLRKKLRAKKFLIVLDDMWIEEDEKAKWDNLSDTISCGAEESILVMTTRSQTTSRMMAKVLGLQHTLGCLSEDDSWSLFEKLAFAQGREGDGKSLLEPTGREIVKKCKGLPLAVKTLGSLMWSKRSIAEWEHVKKSNIWELQEKNDILPALKLSYNNLFPHLKRCFAYCCLFPKGYEIKKDEMVQLWVSNGFIPPRGETSVYLIGEEIFNCLVWRSFFQLFKEDVSDHIHRYNMHDLMHDMARHVMKDELLVTERNKEVIIQDMVLHLSSLDPDFVFPCTDVGKLTSLRSIIMYEKLSKEHILSIDIHKHLRALYMRHIWLVPLPESIWKLKHLKYLNLSSSRIESLSESIVYLQNLQVLLLIDCDYLCMLPRGLRYLSNLQCFDISKTTSIKHLPEGIKELTNLRILPYFPVGHNIGSKISELRDQNNLEGTLEISGLTNVRGLIEARSANLKAKQNLSVLKLEWDRFIHAYNNEEVLEGLEPNPCLKRLEIQFYRGKIFSPSWMVSLSNLVEIRFSWCYEFENIPPLGRLPNLRSIELFSMHYLKCFHDDDIGNVDMFPSLQELRISFCSKLVSLPSNIQNLRVLRLEECPKLVSLPEGIQSFKYLNELMICYCGDLSERCEKEKGVDWPKISHIPNVDIRVSSLLLDTEPEHVYEKIKQPRY